MNDLQRFFRQLVTNLAAVDPARVHRPLAIADIQHDILPYRANRRALQVDTSEDYESLLLRLCAGEDGLATMEPHEIQTRFALELKAPSPDLSLLNQHADARLLLATTPVTQVLRAHPHAAYAPPGDSWSSPEPAGNEEYAPGGREEETSIEADAPTTEAISLDDIRLPPEPMRRRVSDRAPMCPYCGSTLPVGRQVNFCPQCGQTQSAARCSECLAEIEVGWRHCIACGALAAGEAPPA